MKPILLFYIECYLFAEIAVLFSQTLYKSQSEQLKEEIEEKIRSITELEEERGSLAHQLQLALARADSEALARSIAEETVADLEKEKTMKELELKELMAKHRVDSASKEATITNVSYCVFSSLKRSCS